MAYKFFQGTLNTSGTLNVENAITGNALLVDTGGITVSTGLSTLQAVSAQTTNVTVLSASTGISASAAQFGSLTVTTLAAPNLDLSGYLIVSGNTTLGTDGADIIQVKGQITGSLFDINGGTIDNTAIGTTTQNSGQFTTLSASSTLQAGNNATIGGTLNVNGAAASTFTNRVNVGKDGGGLSLSGSGQLQIAGVKNYDQELRSINQKIVVRDGGDANDKAFLDGSGQVSGSGALNIGGNATIAGTLTVNNTATFNNAATFNNTVTIKDLYVTGTITAVQSTDLNISDAKVVIASGTLTTASFDTLDPAGVYVGGSGGGGADAFGSLTLNHNAGTWSWQVLASGANDPVVKVGNGNNGSITIGSTTVLQQTSLFGGAVTGSNTGVAVRFNLTNVSSPTFNPTFSSYILAVQTAGGARTINLPSAGAGDSGKVFLIKDSQNSASINNITVVPNGSDTIDGVSANVVLNSNGAAVHFVVLGANAWGLF